MPELPEVETIARDLRQRLIQARIKDVVIYDLRVVRHAKPSEFVARLRNRKIMSVDRRGKAIIIRLDRAYLVIQVMMTGQLILAKTHNITKATQVVFELSNGQYLLYNDQRLFGRLQIVDDLNKIDYFHHLGPEPLSRDFNMRWLSQELQKRKMPIKTLLMNQHFVAGIGNIYASEILFDCCIRPQRPARSLNPEEITQLRQSTVRVLKKAIRWRGTSMISYRDGNGQKGHFLHQIRVYGRDHEQCFRCGQLLVRIVLSGRSTFYCTHCQH